MNSQKVAAEQDDVAVQAPLTVGTGARGNTPSAQAANPGGSIKEAGGAPAADASASDSEAEERVIPGHRARELLEDLPAWGDLVTIVLHGGCVFEYKGPFPPGTVGRGFYNLQGTRPGFEGHLKLDAIDHIAFQDRPHAGRIAHALTFNDARGRNLFKVFLGRDGDGEIWPEQIARYEALRDTAVPRTDTSAGADTTA